MLSKNRTPKSLWSIIMLPVMAALGLLLGLSFMTGAPTRTAHASAVGVEAGASRYAFGQVAASVPLTTPTLGPTNTRTPTPPPTNTFTPTFCPGCCLSPMCTPTLTPSATPTYTATPTFTPTNTPTPLCFSPMCTTTPTHTFTSTPTYTPTNTPTSTNTPTPLCFSPMCTTTPTHTFTPTRTYTPTPTLTSVRVVDLAGSVSWASTCDTPVILRLTTYINGPTFMRTALPSTMRVQNNDGDFRDFPVPWLGLPTPISYTYDCVVGSCVPSSWITSLPITLTVDVFNQVFEHDETNNTNTLGAPPPLSTPCPTNTFTPTHTVTSTPSYTPTYTPTAVCEPAAYVRNFTASCSSPSSYNYSFSVYQYVCATANGSGVVHFQVSPNQTGPWTDYGSAQFFSGPFNFGDNVRGGTFDGSAIPPQYLWWRIDIFGNVQGQAFHKFFATSTPAPLCTTPQEKLIGHVTWQGRPAQPHPLQSLPASVTLRWLNGGVNFGNSTTTDQYGFYTITVGLLPNGNYTWWTKGPKFLATSGNFDLADVDVSIEMGLQRAGDANNSNCVDVSDFSIVRAAYGTAVGDPNYDARADFNGDDRVSIIDFNLLRANFGACGPPSP